MKTIVLAIFSLYSVTLIGQRRLFEAKVHEIMLTRDSFSNIESNTPSLSEFDFRSSSCTILKNQLISSIYSLTQNKTQPIRQSKMLNAFAEATTLAWKGSHYSDKKKWAGLSNHFRRAGNKIQTGFNHIQTFSCRVNLMNSGGKKFYYDRSGTKGELNLYLGERPKTKEEKEAEKIPVSFCTEAQINEQIMHYLARQGIIRKLKKGIYTYVGISIEVDEKSLYKNKIPTARVVVFLGARRLQKIIIPVTD